MRLDLGLAQIYPVWDEDASDERTVLLASISDPYILIIRDDSSLLVLQADNKVEIFFLPNASKPVYIAEGVDFLPPILSPEPPPKRPTSREIITEILVAELGDSVCRCPHLIVWWSLSIVDFVG